VIAILRLLLVAAYLPLAHYAGARHSPTLAVVALADLALVFLIDGLLSGRARAWGLSALVAAGLVALQRSTLALLPLMLVPPLFTGLIAWFFLRSLRRGCTPLIAKPVAALYEREPRGLPPEQWRYVRALTMAWGILLASLTLLNLALATIAVPDGILATLGVVAPLRVTQAQWAWIAGVGSYGLLLLFAVIEFQWRKRFFPVRPYRNGFEFARRMAALGPGFWRDFFRSEKSGEWR